MYSSFLAMAISHPDLTRAALSVVDRAGPDGLTVTAVATELGVKPPSLYKHVRGLDELRVLVGAEVIAEMTRRFADAIAGRSGPDAVRTLMHAYRTFATQFPHRYALAPADPLGDPALAEVGQQQLEVVAASLRAYRLDPSDTVHTLRVLRATAHGFATLETAGGFGLSEDCDQSFERVIAMVLRDLGTRLPTGTSS